MLGYLAAKAVEYKLLIESLKRSLAELRDLPNSHPALPPQLGTKIARLADGCCRLEQIVAAAEPTLAPRGLATLHTMELDLLTHSCYYLPAAKSEGALERRYAALILPAAHRSGLAWVRDILVQLHGGHATCLSIPEIPLMFAPLHQPETLLDLAGVFHEFGHSAFERLEPIRNRLAQRVHDVFLDLRRVPGPVNPEQRAERERTLREAELYWDIRRLAELFCDIFATYTSGPAHYFSCADLAIRSGADPHALDLSDVHPPMATRVEVCARAVLQEHRESLICRRTAEIWSDFLKRYPQLGKYPQYCPAVLLEGLVSEALEAIEAHLPQANHYVGPLPDAPEATDVPLGASLAEGLNLATALLLTATQDYAAWEAQAFTRLLGPGP